MRWEHGDSVGHYTYQWTWSPLNTATSWQSTTASEQCEHWGMTNLWNQQHNHKTIWNDAGNCEIQSLMWHLIKEYCFDWYPGLTDVGWQSSAHEDGNIVGRVWGVQEDDGGRGEAWICPQSPREHSCIHCHAVCCVGHAWHVTMVTHVHCMCVSYPSFSVLLGL